MNQNVFCLGTLALLLTLSGCASSRYKPPEGLSNAAPSAAPPVLSLNETQILERAAAQPATPVEDGDWQPLTDGKTLGRWQPVAYGGKERVEARSGLIFLTQGQPFNGIRYTNAPPTNNFEITLEAMRVSGSDFFCGLTFPVADASCSLIVGGWGGTLVGISNLDGADASENETTQFVSFETGRWYRVRLRVTTNKIEAWVEQKKVVNVTTTGRKLSLRYGDIELSKPLGLTCWDTAAAYRDIKIRSISVPDSEAKE